VFRGGAVVAGAGVMTLALFLVLPLVQAIAKQPVADLTVRSVEAGSLPPPPAPPPEDPEPEPEPEPSEPQLEDAPLPDLAQLELSFNGGWSGDGWGGGDLGQKLDAMSAVQAQTGSALVSLRDLDQPPRVRNPVNPEISDAMRRKAPGTVHILFIVDEQGRVVNPVIQKSTDPVFERPALAAIKKWRFEPGKRNGEPVRFRMRVPFAF